MYVCMYVCMYIYLSTRLTPWNFDPACLFIYSFESKMCNVIVYKQYMQKLNYMH